MKDKDKTKAELIKELKTLRKEREKSALDDITEHKQIEEKYPSFTKDILDASVVGKFILDSDFKVVWINHSIEKYFGLQREKVIGKDKRKLIKKNIQHIFEDPDEFIRRVFATYDNNTYIENFECHVLPDGKRNERWLEHWSQPIKSGLYAGGRIEHYYDITERKQAEEETRQKTEDLFLINALNDAVNRGNSLLNILQLLARETKRIFSCYGATVYLLSEDRECLAMQTFTLPPATMSRAEKLIGMRIPAAISIPLKAGSLYRKVLQEGKPQLINDPKAIQGLMAEFTENKRLKKLIPKIYSILDTRSLINIPLVSKGEAIGLLDVSRKEPFTEFDLKRVETISRQLTSIIERKQAEENLKESRHLLNATEVISKTGGWEVDIQSQKGTWTDEFYRIHEVPFDYDMNVEKGIAFYKPEDQPAIERYFKKAIEEGEPYDLELQFITAKGKHLWVRTIGSPVQKNGKTVKIIGNIQDITERKQAEEKIKHLNLVLRAIRRVNQLIVREKDREKLLKGACENLIKTRGYYNTWIALLDEEEKLKTCAEAGLGKGFLPMIELLKRGTLTACSQKALKQQEVVITEDPASTCTECPLAQKYSGRAGFAIRLEHSGKIYGLMTVSIPAHLAVDQEEQTLFKEVAEVE